MALSLNARRVMHHVAVPSIFFGSIVSMTTAIGWRYDIQDFYPPAWITLISSSLAVVAGALMMQLVYRKRWQDRKKRLPLYPPSGHYTMGSFLIWATVLIGLMALALAKLAPAFCECDDPSIFPEILILMIPMAVLISGAILLMQIPQDAARSAPALARQTVHGFSILFAAVGSSMLLAAIFRAIVFIAVDQTFIVLTLLSLAALGIGAGGLTFIHHKETRHPYAPNLNFTVGYVLVINAAFWIFATLVALN